MLRVVVGTKTIALNSFGFDRLLSMSVGAEAVIEGTFKGNKAILHGCDPVELVDSLRERLPSGAHKLQKFRVYSELSDKLTELEIAAATEDRLYRLVNLAQTAADSDDSTDAEVAELDRLWYRHEEATKKVRALWNELIS